jgi:PKD repeat protein
MVRGMKRIVFGVMLVLLLVGMLALALSEVSAPLPTSPPTDWPSVFFCSDTVSFCTEDNPIVADVGDIVSIALVGFNFTDNTVVDPDNPLATHPLGNLNGFDIQMSWDATILKYVNHTVTVPIENYPNPIPPSPYAGILHEDTFKLVSKVDETDNIPNAEPGTMAWFAYATMPDAPVFNGNGTFFTMTFNVTKKGSSVLKLTNVGLSGEGGNMPQVESHTFDGLFNTPNAPTADFTFWPDVGVINKTVIFNASDSFSPVGLGITNYTWDFDDGNITSVSDPIIHHAYNASAEYTVSLVVNGSDGVSSSPKTEQVTVVNKRNVMVADVSPSALNILAGKAVDITVRVEDDGDADESFTLAVYYNATSVNWADISTTSWIKINESNVFLSKYSFSIKLFTWNTTGVPQVNARYYILANVTQVPYEDVNDNNMISDPVFIVSMPLHNVAIEKLEVGWGGDFEQPVLYGEDVRFQITVLNNGTVDETAVNVTLYCDDSMLESWNESMQCGENIQLIFEKSFASGSYNITVWATIENDVYLDNNFMEETLKVIEVPKLNVTYAPDCPLANCTVIFDASASFHQEPGASITLYRWHIYNPEGILVKSTYGADLVNITHKLGEEGEWQVVLSVKDNYNIAYNMQRPATSAYRIQATINVEEGLTYSFEAYTWNSITYYVNVTSNSTVTDFHFNPNVGPSIEFSVAGTMGTGSCQVAIPQSLLWVDDGEWEVLVGGEPVDYAVIQDGNTTYLCFVYGHSTKTVQIMGTHAIPEFPSAITLLLFMASMMLVLILIKKLPKTRQRHR